ncbi:MAG: hypothetical protein R3B48_03110 [Kofleriaceae bacterium]
MSAVPGPQAPALAAGTRLGDYVLGELLWRLRLAEVYAARGPTAAATLYVIAPQYAGHPEIRAEIIAGTRAAAALPEHPSVVRTVAAGLTGEILWIATEDVDGVCVRELLRKKVQGGATGLGAAGAATVVLSAAAAVEAAVHGALGADSIIASRDGRPRVADLALARGILAAARLGVLSERGGLAPEAAAAGAPSPSADIYGLGGLLYEALVGVPFERGGPRPTEVVASLPAQLDEVIARCCHRDPQRRFGSVAALREIVTDLIGRGAEPPTAAGSGRLAPAGGSPSLAPAGSSPSLAQAIAHAPRATPMPIDASLAMALSDETERWLVSKGQLDYGPFSLATVVEQIEQGKILGAHIIIDADSGARTEVSAHPLLGPISDAAKARHDDERRVAAEAAHRRTETKRGALLYAVIAVAVIGVGGGAFWGIKRARTEERTTLAAVKGVGSASIDLNVSAPKRPARAPRSRSGRAPRPGAQASDDYALDFSGDEGDDATETLDLDTIHKVYSRQGGALGRCLAQNGGGTANIAFSIDGPSGKVTVVRVNGATSGGLATCVGRVMRSLSFPTVKGPRTRAEFDISM